MFLKNTQPIPLVSKALVLRNSIGCHRMAHGIVSGQIAAAGQNQIPHPWQRTAHPDAGFAAGWAVSLIGWSSHLYRSLMFLIVLKIASWSSVLLIFWGAGWSYVCCLKVGSPKNYWWISIVPLRIATKCQSGDNFPCSEHPTIILAVIYPLIYIYIPIWICLAGLLGDNHLARFSVYWPCVFFALLCGS